MDPLLKKARHVSGEAAFEKRCRCTLENGRRVKAYKVPGTIEAGRWAMLNRRTNDLLDEYRRVYAEHCARLPPDDR